MKPEVFNAFNLPVGEPTCSGNRYEPLYQMVLDMYGHKELIATGDTKDLYAIIQENSVGVELHDILKRCMLRDDYSELVGSTADYFDATVFPENYISMQNQVINAKGKFYSLPPEVREKFHNNADEFIISVGKPDFYDKLGLTQKSDPKPEAKKTEEETEQ